MSDATADPLPDVDTDTEEKTPVEAAKEKDTRSSQAVKESIRVEVEKLNRLMNLSGEMLTAKIHYLLCHH